MSKSDSSDGTWYCWACEVDWNRQVEKTKLCPECGAMGVAAELM